MIGKQIKDLECIAKYLGYYNNIFHFTRQSCKIVSGQLSKIAALPDQKF
jgi:hypothetical protein